MSSASDNPYKSAPLRPRLAPRSIRAFAIVAAEYNLEYTQSMAEHAIRELTILEQGASVQTFWAPGSFEIPVLVKLLAAQGRYDAILAFGVIFDGETAHAALVAQSVTQALQEIAVNHGVPILDGVLFLNNAEHAIERCHGLEKNRGVEAARAAISVSRTVREIQAK